MSLINPLSNNADTVWKKFATSKDQENIELKNRTVNGVCFKIDPSGLPNKSYIVTYGSVGEDRIGNLNSRILWLHQDNEIRPLLGSSRPKRQNASLAPLLM